VPPGLPAVLVDSPPPPPQPTEKSTGRRKQLAGWLADAANPLTARVMVNRIWQHHFGEGIVSTENDFGLMGQPPSHPELLDWLAAEFVAGGWKIKPLHRLIMLSSCYQQAARPAIVTTREGNVQVDPAQNDPDNQLLWHWRPRRLEAEAIRDSVLAASGQLHLERGGPSVFPKIAPGVLAGQSIPGNGWKPSPPEQANRRSVYIFVKRTLLVPELEVLDFPSTNASCEQRVVSTIAPQALTYLNGDFLQEQARFFAQRLIAEAGGDPAAQIERAFRLALCRPANEAERQAALDFLTAQRRQIDEDQPAGERIDGPRKALEAFCLVLLNTNEFAYLE
jgi:hypothetical protein